MVFLAEFFILTLIVPICLSLVVCHLLDTRK